MPSTSPESITDGQDCYDGFVRSYPGHGQEFTSVDTMLLPSSFKVIALDLNPDGTLSDDTSDYTLVIPVGATISHRDIGGFLEVRRRCSERGTTEVADEDYGNTQQTADWFPNAPWAGGLGFVIDDSRAEGTAYWVGGRAPLNPRYDLGPRSDPTPEQIAGLRTEPSSTHVILTNAQRDSAGCAFEPVIARRIRRVSPDSDED